YTALLFVITFLTTRKADNDAFYRGNRNSPWFVVAYGMVGASLSGVTFMSVPGNVMRENFYYFPMVLGFIAGYVVVATVLLPLYYKLNLTSIYTYIDKRFGVASYKSGAAFFLLSRSLGATLRMFLVISVLYEFVFKPFGLPFWAVTALFILLILGYTFKGGIRTIVWTDTLQTTFMLLAVIISIVCICRYADWSFVQMLEMVRQSPYAEVFQTDPTHKRYFLKQFVSGLFVTVTMTGLDQDMMQKNLSCRNLRDAQKNMFSFSAILLVMNIFFLVLGAILCLYAVQNGISCIDTDYLFPEIAIRRLPVVAGLTFMIGVLSAAYSSADGAMTALTTSFTIDILGVEKKRYGEERVRKIRYRVHLCTAVLFFLFIMMFYMLKSDAVINMVYDIASYTYGPLLGLFFAGIYTKWRVKDRWVPFVVLASPVLSFVIVQICKNLGYNFGFELLLLNGALTVLGIWLFRQKTPAPEVKQLYG
ncbi:MAG: sodium:solute symporter, partial [Bacteroidales bacterium]|nr:sodium:solute symporter [Bacteroidales bacterium]